MKKHTPPGHFFSSCMLPLFLLWFTACEKIEPHKIENLNENRIGVIGHGGMGIQSYSNQLPHNSFSSVVQTIEKLNADGVEVDVQLSRDGVLILYHSKLLESSTDCFSCVHESYAEDLIKCRYRNDFYANVFTNEKVTTLEKVVKRFSDRSIKPLLFLDLKTFLPCETDLLYEDYRQNMVDALLVLIEKYQAEDWIIIESWDLELLKMIRENNSSLKLKISTGKTESILEAHEHGFYGIVMEYREITREEVGLAHSLGVKVSLYSPKSRRGIRKAIEKNPDFIQTDNVILLQQFLN